MHPPGSLPTRLVKLATGILPTEEARGRYRHELIAEMQGLSYPRQLRFAFGVMISSMSLRAATAPRTLPAPVDHVRPQPVSCRLDLYHRWRVHSTSDGDRYLACSRCGREKDVIPPGPWSVASDIISG